jgi:hypothetical protein
VREHRPAVLDLYLELVALKETRFSPQPLDLALKFSLAPWLEVNAARVRLEDGLRFALNMPLGCLGGGEDGAPNRL